jgi:hypothetical protein
MKLHNLLEMAKSYAYKKGFIQDGMLKSGDGRVVIYDDKIAISKSTSTDHNDLLRALAQNFPKNMYDTIISKAIRLYFREYKDGYIFNGVRKIDDEDFYKDKEKNIELIKSKLK